MGWQDPGLHCYSAHEYVDDDESTQDGFNSVSCIPRGDMGFKIDPVPGTVLLACGSTFWPTLSKNNGQGGVWSGAEIWTDSEGVPGCRAWQQKGMALSVSAWCCWPTRDDGQWNANEVDLSTSVVTKQETENDEFTNTAQEITAGCAAQQGGTGANAKAGSMGFL